MAEGEQPPNQLAELLQQRGLSKRRFAKMLYDVDPSMTWDSWIRAVRQYTHPTDPVVPKPDRAALMEKVLGLPAGRLVQPNRRELREERLRRLDAENRRLHAELARLQAELDRLRSGRGDSPA